MIVDAEKRYLRELGFTWLGLQDDVHCLRAGAEVTAEGWMLAYHLFGGRVCVDPDGAGPGIVAGPARTSTSGEAREIAETADHILEEALSARASDIHLEPSEKALRLRFRLDGRLVLRPEIPLDRRDALVAHLKIRAGMDIAEKRRPQDGRIHFKGTQRSVDLRVSTLPTQYGEKMVMRILDKSDLTLDLAHLGFPAHTLTRVQKIISAPHGMVLVTGPTGSGKTTTLYSCLTHIRGDALNITTIEDPIEYRLDGINQTQVKPEIGVTFAEALRTLLRQDPNVIMVGEIRDEETAALATRASLTGHLVLSTLHTNDAAGAVPRLSEMGVQTHLLAAALNLVVAQRLVRALCVSCRASVPVDGSMRGLLGEDVLSVYAPVGCDRCMHTGFKGRRGVYEVMFVDEGLRGLISSGADVARLRRLACEGGMKLLADEAVDLVRTGTTTLEEVNKEAIL